MLKLDYTILERELEPAEKEANSRYESKILNIEQEFQKQLQELHEWRLGEQRAAYLAYKAELAAFVFESAQYDVIDNHDGTFTHTLKKLAD